MSKLADSRVRATEAVSGLQCPECGGEVYPCHSADSFLFYCRSGHRADVADLATLQGRSLRKALECMLRNWKMTLKDLEGIAADADRRGLHDIAEIYRRQVRNLAGRIQIMRDYLEKTPPALD